MKTTVTELPESRVRVEAEVPAEEVERRVEQTARGLGRDLRIPGFRKGKVPAPVVVRRLGRPTVLDEALRSSMGGWYADALEDSGVKPVGDPQLEVGDLPGPGEPLTFSVEVGVRPKATLGRWEGLEVGRREPEVADAEVDAEVEQLREKLARLDTVDRPAETGDFVVMDYLGKIDDVAFPGGEGRDQLLELGSGRLIPGFEEQLVGARAGEHRTVEVTFPDDYQATELAGKRAVFDVDVKEVKHKQLPDLDDDFAVEAGGADTLEELRGEIRERLSGTKAEEVEQEFREAVLDAIVAEATVDVPDALVEARARELWERMLHSLGHQGIDRETYLRITGRSEDEILEEAKPDAAQALRRDAVVSALREATGAEPSDEDLVEALGPSAERAGTPAAQLLDRLRSEGRLDEVREDVAARKALDLAVERATPIPLEQARARDELWTPEKEQAEAGSATPAGQIWTPGS